MRELRRHVRVPLQSQVAVTHFDVVHQLRIGNASASGLFLEGDPRELPEFSVGAEVTVRVFDESQAEDQDVIAMARIVRVERGKGLLVSGVAVEFTEVDDEDQERLDALIAGYRQASA